VAIRPRSGTHFLRFLRGFSNAFRAADFADARTVGTRSLPLGDEEENGFFVPNPRNQRNPPFFFPQI
jgi:hypothetical protein